jgi:IS5 family transposase
VRSERLLMEQLNYNLLFRWFVGLNMDDPVWDRTHASTTDPDARLIRKGKGKEAKSAIWPMH